MTTPKKSYPPDRIHLYNRYFEYERVVSNVAITDEGVYQQGQVPETYGGARLDIQCVHAVFMINAKAEMIVLEFEVEPPMDSERKTGGPIIRDGKQVRPATGASTVDLIQTTIPNAQLDASRKALGQVAKAAFTEALNTIPNQPMA